MTLTEAAKATFESDYAFRPIRTAPQDGTILILVGKKRNKTDGEMEGYRWFSTGRFLYGQWISANPKSCQFVTDGCVLDPTGWAPLEP